MSRINAYVLYNKTNDDIGVFNNLTSCRVARDTYRKKGRLYKYSVGTEKEAINIASKIIHSIFNPELPKRYYTLVKPVKTNEMCSIRDLISEVPRYYIKDDDIV